jgi:hypothetical protein
MESTRAGCLLQCSKKSKVAAMTAFILSNNSQCVTSRRKCRQSISDVADANAGLLGHVVGQTL